jgi:hypothetical protein
MVEVVPGIVKIDGLGTQVGVVIVAKAEHGVAGYMNEHRPAGIDFGHILIEGESICKT